MTIKAMYLFFDVLYTKVDLIDTTLLNEWNHKQTPVKRYCIMTNEEANQATLNAEDVSYIAITLDEAKEELSYY